MADCVTCGDELHPERAEKYDYCTKPECRERNAEALPILAVGVNKAADQFVVLNERTEEEMKGGRYKKAPEAPGTIRRRARSRRHREPSQVSPGVRRSSPAPPRPP
jgi:hypothetical protein